MKERLEQFIDSNRPAFDEATPPEFIWEEISKKVNTEKKAAKVVQFRQFKVWAAAAAIIIISTVSFLLVENQQLQKDLAASRQTLEQKQSRQEDQINWVHSRELNQFIQIVADKQNQLSGIRSEYPTLYKSFTTDINELNKVYKELKEELLTVPEQEEILNAMIQNLKLQAELLNEQILIIQQIKSSKKHSNEKTIPFI